MSTVPSVEALAARYPCAEVARSHHSQGARYSARIPRPGGGHALVIGRPEEVADWLREQYETPAGATRPDPVTPAGHCHA